MPKNDSTIKLPINNVGNTTTTPVSIGIKPLRNTCLNNTVRSLKPLALAVGVVVLVIWLLEVSEITQYVRVANELERMNQEITELEQANSALEKEISLVQNDEFTLEKLARERLGYVRKGEIVYQLVEPE